MKSAVGNVLFYFLILCVTLSLGDRLFYGERPSIIKSWGLSSNANPFVRLNAHTFKAHIYYFANGQKQELNIKKFFVYFWPLYVTRVYYFLFSQFYALDENLFVKTTQKLCDRLTRQSGEKVEKIQFSVSDTTASREREYVCQ